MLDAARALISPLLERTREAVAAGDASALSLPGLSLPGLSLPGLSPAQLSEEEAASTLPQLLVVRA